MTEEEIGSELYNIIVHEITDIVQSPYLMKALGLEGIEENLIYLSYNHFLLYQVFKIIETIFPDDNATNKMLDYMFHERELQMMNNGINIDEIRIYMKEMFGKYMLWDEKFENIEDIGRIALKQLKEDRPITEINLMVQNLLINKFDKTITGFIYYSKNKARI